MCDSGAVVRIDEPCSLANVDPDSNFSVTFLFCDLPCIRAVLCDGSPFAVGLTIGYAAQGISERQPSFHMSLNLYAQFLEVSKVHSVDLERLLNGFALPVLVVPGPL